MSKLTVISRNAPKVLCVRPQNLLQQECIPVGCVLSAAVAVCRGMSAWGVCICPRGLCLPGVRGIWQTPPCAQNDRRLGCVCPEDMSAWGVCICPRGLCLPRGEGCLADTPLWTEWQTLVKILPYRNYVADDKNVPLLVKYDEFLLYTDIFVEINMKFRVSISYLHGHLKIYP